MSIVHVKQLASHILNNPLYYPGPHHTPQQRTSRGVPMLDTHRQAVLIWDAMCSYLCEHLSEGRAVNIPKLGTMTFEPIRVRDNYGKENIFQRPCFIPTAQLADALFRSSGKNEGAEAKPGATCYSTRNTVYLNYVPIAAGTYLKHEVVKAGLEAMFSAVIDLVKREYNLSLNFGCAKIKIVNRCLNVQFSKALSNVRDSVAQQQLRKSQTLPKLSDTWRNPAFSQSMMNFMARPDSKNYSRKIASTNNLRIMSLDLNSCRAVTMKGHKI
eukprot:GEMP01062657.1.p1 GENE.GEMP01062657.1~~GEMP01062657.1.p1  ORF type:complete len:295 (+),score=43.85 GEMP01062657.1:77-886(+)